MIANQMLAVQPLTGEQLPPYLLLAEPGLRRTLLEGQSDPNQTVLGAAFWGQPAGVAVVHFSEEAARLSDLYVLPSYRQAGVGSALLAAAEARAADAGKARIQALYRPTEQTPVFERMLVAAGWAAPTRSGTVFWSRCSVAMRSWLRFRFRPPYEVFPWPELTAAERAELVRRGEAGWYPPELSPFHRPDDAWDPLSSVGLRREGEVVGWSLSVREAPDQLLADVMFVDPPLQRLGRGFMLLGEVVRRYCASGGDYCYWRVSPENEAMQRWTRKAYGPAILDEYEEWFSEKVLCP